MADDKAARRKKRKPYTKPQALNAQQRRFVEEYLVDFNGTQAAIRAGYKPQYAKVTASRLLAYPSVATALAKGREELTKDTRDRREKIITELERIGFADIRHVVEFGPKGVRLKQDATLDESSAAVIQEVYQQSGKVSKIGVRLHDKLGALIALARTEGMLNDRIKVEDGSALGLLRSMLTDEPKTP